MYILTVYSKVWVQLQNMIDFYEKKNNGIGNRFLKDYEVTIIKLKDSPYSYFNPKNNKRRIAFKVFQCMLIYEIKGITIEVQVLKDLRSKPNNY